MFDVLSRSWELTKLSFRVIRQDKEMLLFPLLSGLMCILFIASVITPMLMGMGNVNLDEWYADAMVWVFVFMLYLGIAVIVTFFGVCVVYTTKVRFEGGDATFGESFKFAVSRLHLIFQWGLLSATVGMILRAIDNIARRAGGDVVADIISNILGAAWNIVTLFVVPAMVYREAKPIPALKSSVETIKKTWGESLVRHFGLGAIQFVAIVLAVILGIGFILIFQGLGDVGFGIGFGILVLLVLAVILIFNVANSVYNTALYVYAAEGQIPAGFDEEHLGGAFRQR